MTPSDIRTICKFRFDGWTRRFVQSHATPVIAVGFSHDEQSGQMVICMVDHPDMTNWSAAQLLRKAVDLLEQVPPLR